MRKPEVTLERDRPCRDCQEVTDGHTDCLCTDNGAVLVDGERGRGCFTVGEMPDGRGGLVYAVQLDYTYVEAGSLTDAIRDLERQIEEMDFRKAYACI